MTSVIDGAVTVPLARFTMSVLIWMLLLFSIPLMRLEWKYWANMSMLTVILPMLIWWLGNHSIFLSAKTGTVFMVSAFSVLFMILLTEGFRWAKLKKYLKEYGKNPKDTAVATLIVTASMVVGAGVAYISQSGDVLRF